MDFAKGQSRGVGERVFSAADESQVVETQASADEKTTTTTTPPVSSVSSRSAPAQEGREAILTGNSVGA